MDDHLPVPVTPHRPPRAGPVLGRASSLALAVASRGIGTVRDALGQRPRPADALDLASGVAVLTAETVGAVLDTATALTGEAARAAARRLGPVQRVVEERAMVPLRTVLVALEDRGRLERRRSEAEFDLLLDAVVPRVVAAVLDRIDLTALVRARVDLDAVAADLDVDAVAQRVDVNAIARRVDVEEIAARVDVDAVAARLDLEAVIDRIDLEALTEDVLDSIDLPSVIRQSTGAMASDTVVDVRLQGIEADVAVNRFVDRLLRRRTRRTQAPRRDDEHDDVGPEEGP